MRSNMSGVGFYNSEPRNFSRGFGRGNSRPYQSSQPPPSSPSPRKGDLFVDAGRLAVEYLVSRGLLSSNVLLGKSHDKEISNSLDSRRSPNNQDMKISRSDSRDSRKWNRENGRENSSPPQAVEVDDDKFPKDSSKEENSDVCYSRSVESATKNGEELPKSVNESNEENVHGIESPIQQSENNDGLAKEKTDMTKVHCFLTDSRMNTEPLSMSEEVYVSNSAKDDNMSIPTKIKSSSDISSSNFPDQLKHMESLPLTDNVFYHKQECSEFPELKKDGNEKRAFEGDSRTEGAKKPKHWLSVGQSNEYLQLSNLEEKKPISLEKRDADIFNESSDPESFHNVSLPQQGGVESIMYQREEKQLLESSYKIFDLNLMEASDNHENHSVGALFYPSLSVQKKEQIDIDLSMSNNCSLINEYSEAKKDVEIIDLESPTTELGEGAKFSIKSEEAGIITMENLEDNPQRTNDNPDGQDGYGFMISELLGNDVPHCSTAQPDSNSLQGDMGLHHGENLFTEDDPIYMSLGEIPLTGLLQAWEQPTQDKNPFEV